MSGAERSHAEQSSDTSATRLIKWSFCYTMILLCQMGCVAWVSSGPPQVSPVQLHADCSSRVYVSVSEFGSAPSRPYQGQRDERLLPRFLEITKQESPCRIVEVAESPYGDSSTLYFTYTLSGVVTRAGVWAEGTYLPVLPLMLLILPEPVESQINLKVEKIVENQQIVISDHSAMIRSYFGLLLLPVAPFFHPSLAEHRAVRNLARNAFHEIGLSEGK